MSRKMKLSSLVFDYRFYPRQHLNNYHVGEIIEALKAGTPMPPLRADKSTHIVTDGWHRGEAFRRKDGDSTIVEVELIEYKDETEMFQDAIRLNSSHGQALSAIDGAHCLAKAQEFKLEQAVVASLLNITTERAEELVSNRMAISADGPIVLKGSTAFMAGKRLTAEQVEYNRKAGGLPQTFYINQVVSMLESDSLNWEDERVINGLKRLSHLLEETLKPVGTQ